jgi:hypothetical protein
MLANRTNLLEIVAANAPDPDEFERVVSLIHVTRQFDDANGHVPPIWREDDAPEHGDLSMPGEMAACAMCGMASRSGEHVRICEEGGPAFWACEDGHACAARMDSEA